MSLITFNTYFLVSIIFIVMTGAISFFSFKKKTKMGRTLCISGIFTSLSVISYFVRVFTDSVTVFSVMTSIYLVCIDISLLFFLSFILYFSKYTDNPWRVPVIRGYTAFTFIEAVIYFVNIFYPIAIKFAVRDTEISKVFYDSMTPVYWAHMLFSYVLIISILVILYRQSRRVPKQFGRQYFDAGACLVIILVANFLGGGFHKGLVDYSVGGYCLIVLFMYWYAYKFSTHDMLNYFKTSIFENVDQAIVLFDYGGRMVLNNERAVRMFQDIVFDENLELNNFVSTTDLAIDLQSGIDVFSFQCYVKGSHTVVPLRCDFHCLRNEKNLVLGYLFVFTDAVRETDALTSFQDWESFRFFAANNKDAFTFPMTAIVCDINNLSVINNTRGHNVGDQLLKEFSERMKEVFPQGSYFVRGPEAELIALSHDMEMNDVEECISKIRSETKIQFLYAMETASTWSPSIMVAIESACLALRQKKLLDKGTVHSEMLNSLIKALQECDPDTEAHVQRTQKMGEALGRRIGLTDKQQSDLSLLCLLHDIGKIGVPLEILNKPTKLSDEEWKTIQNHVEKGYQIAKSSKDLCNIADMIRHHHERWDGRGYPDGLSRENIPLLSRVISVVDSFDAMVSDRAYRKGMPIDAAMTELMRCSGTQFDPFLVTEFLPICQMLAAEKYETQVPSSPAAKLKSMQESEEDKPSKVVGHVHELYFARYVLDQDMLIIHVDDNFEKLTGYTRDDVQNMKLHQTDLIPQEDVTEYLCLVSESLANKQMAYCEHRICCKDGSIINVFCFGKIFFDSVSRELHSEIIFTKCSDTFAMKTLLSREKELGNRQLKHWEESFRRDDLTKLLNQIAFKKDVVDLLNEGQFKALFLMIDLDHFKQFNEYNGRQEGNEYLMFFAKSIQGVLRDSDIAGRMGGDEFSAAIFFKNDVDAEFIRGRAQELFDKLSKAVSADEHKVSFSMGAAVFAEGSVTYDQLYDCADKALFRSKEGGCGRLSIGEVGKTSD